MAGLGAEVSLARRADAQATEREQLEALSRSNGLNIIVVIADTFRWDYLHFNGNERIRTPNLDALASEGVYFANCYADGLPTIPSRRVMHTGMSIIKEKGNWWHPLSKGHNSFPRKDRVGKEQDVTFAEILGKAGFTTGFIVDTFHYFKPDMNFHYGFDSFQWIRGQEADRYISGPRDSIHPENHCPAHLLNDQYRDAIVQYLLNTRDFRYDDDYFAGQSCAAAVRWLEDNRDNDGPFMLFIDMFDPHEPWDAPPRFQKMYRATYPFERYIFGYGVNVDDVCEEDIPILIDLYSAEVTYSDYCIVKLIDGVKRLGLWDDTIIVFSTDHGTHLGEQGCIQKQAKLLNSLIARVPAIIRCPDSGFRGKRISGLTSHMDFLPTFLSLLGVEANMTFDGQNMWELVTGAREELRNHVATGYGAFGAVHTHDWHYYRNVRGTDPGLGPQLYDLRKDPREEVDVVSRNPGVAEDMARLLEASFAVALK